MRAIGNSAFKDHAFASLSCTCFWMTRLSGSRPIDRVVALLAGHVRAASLSERVISLVAQQFLETLDLDVDDRTHLVLR